MRIALLGTGLMGRPMAERLLDRGVALTVWNRTRSLAEPLAARGARMADSPASAMEDADAAILMLRDGPVVRQVLFDGSPKPALGGRTVIQMSTIGSAESTALAADVEAAGGEYLEAPVLGSTPQARDGKLQVMAGASPELLGRWEPLLQHLGRVIPVGPVGSAATLKLALNQFIAPLAMTFSAGLGMVRRKGIPIEAFLDILRHSAFYAASYDARLQRMLERDYANAFFPLELLQKDVELVRAEARALGLGTDVIDAVCNATARLVEQGLGRADYGAIYEAVDPARE